MRRRKIENPLLDPLHWVGWIMTITVLSLVWHFVFHISLGTFYYISLASLAVLVMLDVLKHYIGLQ